MNVSPRLSARLIGTWELLTREDRTVDGGRRTDAALGADPLGLLIYDRGGNFAAQFMKRDRSGPAFIAPAGAAPANNTVAQGGYDAYFGAYEVDDERGAVTQRLIGALAPQNVGHVVTRAMSVEGDTLLITLDTTSTDGEPITRTLRWRRVA